MISHVSHGFNFLGENQRSFNTSKISKNWLRHSQERNSKSSELIMGESMSIMISKIIFTREGFSCNTQFPILYIKMELFSGKIDL
jgi:hypothetical protein